MPTMPHSLLPALGLHLASGLKGVDAIEDFKFEDFELEGYHPYPTIKMEMAV